MRPLKMMIALAAAAVLTATGASAAKRQPNFLIIVADDMGYSDLGAFGGEIDTPNLDALARRGVRMTGFHTAPTCSPTRAMLLTGVDNHRAGLGTMSTHIGPELEGKPGYEGYLRKDVPTLAEMMSQAGYHTAMVGKWHLGQEEDQSPAARGFHKSFTMLEGTQNHFGANQDERWDTVGELSTFREGRALAKYPTGVYDADYYAERLIGFLNEAGPDKPFFAYMALTQPHWPLQAPQKTIAKYKGRYDAGPEALRDARLERQKALGLVPSDVMAHPLVGAKPWQNLSAEERALEARKMEVYAAMIDEMDQSVGRVLETLRQRGQLDDTIVVFMSDNGPHARREERPSVRPHRAPTPQDFAALRIDNSLENLGAASSYTSYGPIWAQAGSAPMRLYKGLTTQGGIRATALVAGPGVAGGRISPAFLHVADIAPTVLDLAGPEAQTILKSRNGPPMEGRSWAKLLQGSATEVRGPDEAVGWELFFGRAVRQGDWKASYVVMPGPGGLAKARWELFNLRADPGETQNLAEREPQRLQALVKAWEGYARRNGVVLPSQAAGAPALAQP